MHYIRTVSVRAASRASGYDVTPRHRPPAARDWLPYVAVAALTIWTYWPVHGFGFVNFDDPGYVSANPDVARGLDRASVVWAFTTNRTANWIPVTWLSYLLDVSLFGVRPGAHHVVNVVLHVANALLLLALLRRLGCTPARSFVISALFALHPLRVESVAWISERKDVLCAFFGLCSVHVWVSWIRNGRWWRYAAAVALYALGLMAKPMLVTLPFVLLLLDVAPLRRVGRPAGSSWALLAAEKLPFLVLGAVSSVITMVVQRGGGAVTDLHVVPAGARLGTALAAYAWYAAKTLWPTNLAALHPNPALVGGRAPATAVVAGVLLLLVAALTALRERQRRPWLLVGWGIFFGMLVPVVGLVQVGQQFTADRYTYLPAIGLAVVLVGLAAEAASRLRLAPTWRAAVVVVVLGAAMAASRHQIGFWRDSETLARRAIAVTSGNYVMHFNLALALDERGDLPGALASYAEAVRLRPDLAGFRVNHAAALARSGRVAEACAEYETAMRLDPRDPAARNNLAWLRATHPDASRRDGARALALASALAAERPSDPDTLDLLAAALAESGRFADAQRTAEAAALAARRAGRSDLATQIDARRALYAAGQAYREDPATAVPAAPAG